MSRIATQIARRFLADRRGAIAAMTALLATTLVGFGGLAAETAFWYAQKRALQTQADAAALSGAYELLQGNSANAATWATRDAVLNGFNNTAPNSISSTCSGTSCQVTLTLQHGTALASAFLPTVTIKAQATAQLFDPGNVACIIATGTGAVLALQNGTSTVNNCTLVVPNAANPASVTIANSSVTADTIWSHGGYKVTGTAPTFTRPAMTYTASSSTYMPRDPYAGNLPTLPTSLPTAISPCATQFVSGKNSNIVTLPAWTPATPNQGVYTALSFDNGNNKKYDCGGISTINLKPGIYFITAQDANGYSIDIPNPTTFGCISPNCTCSSSQGGSGVTFIILPDGSGKSGGVQILGNANVTLCPPNTATSGSGASIPKDLLFYQCDTSNANATCKTATSFGNSIIKTGSNTGVSLTGVIYFPGSLVTFEPPSGSSDLKCFITVAKLVVIKGITNNTNATNCTAAGISTGFPGTGIVAQKTYQVVMTQ